MTIKSCLTRVMAAIVAPLLVMACSPVETTLEIELKISPEEIVFGIDGGSQYLFVQTYDNINVVPADSWCQVSPIASESEKMKKFEVTVPEHKVTSTRCTTLSIMAENAAVGTVTVIQKGCDLIVDVAPVDLPASAGTFTVFVQSASDYQVTSDASWLTLKEKDTEKQEAVFAVEENLQLYMREAVLEFRLGNDKYEVEVTQAGNNGDAPAPDMTGMESDAKTLMKKMTLGINLGNTLEAIGGETAWGAPKTTEEIILYFKQLGFNAVRIPCSWDQNLENGEGYIVKSSWMSRVKEVVDYVVKNDMYAILNIHWDGGWLENDIPNGYDEAVDEQQKSLWTQIATVFRDYDEHLVFAGTNEPNVEDAGDMEVLLRYEQTFIDAVRATGGRNAYRVLVFQGPSTDVNKTDELMKVLPEDKVKDRLAAEVHYYTPWQFCGLTEDASWGKMMYFWGEDQKDYATGAYAGRWLSGNNEDLVAKQMAKMKKKFWDKGIPVIIGEYSVCSTRNCNLGTEQENERAKEGYSKSRAAFNGCVVREAKSNGCVPFYWHCEGDLISRRDLKVTEQTTYDAIIEAGKTQYPD